MTHPAGDHPDATDTQSAAVGGSAGPQQPAEPAGCAPDHEPPAGGSARGVPPAADRSAGDAFGSVGDVGDGPLDGPADLATSGRIENHPLLNLADGAAPEAAPSDPADMAEPSPIPSVDDGPLVHRLRDAGVVASAAASSASAAATETAADGASALAIRDEEVAALANSGQTPVPSGPDLTEPEAPGFLSVGTAAVGALPDDDGAPSYYDRAFDEPDEAPSPDTFREFAARGGSMPPVTPAPPAPAAPILAASDHTPAAASIPAPVPIPLEPTQPAAPQPPVVAGERTNGPHALPADEPARVPPPPLGYEFTVGPGFDVADALAPEPVPVGPVAADAVAAADDLAGSTDHEADDAEAEDAEPLGYEIGYESAAEPEFAGASGGGRWTIPLLCLGIGLIACCLLIPLADGNRRAAYERQKLRQDLESIQTQVAVNDEFLRRVHTDPTLAERLAQRQMKTIRAGTRVLTLDGPRRGSAGGTAGPDASPFQLVAVRPPPPLPAYRPVGGTIARLCYRPRTRLYLMGVGLFCMAGGLVLGATNRRA